MPGSGACAVVSAIGLAVATRAAGSFAALKCDGAAEARVEAKVMMAEQANVQTKTNSILMVRTHIYLSPLVAASDSSGFKL